ncbi:VIT family-domain-containing protein [Phyllosticta citriasiana]|uniref:VIT family-domain-containing protein n=1 Tax=Phyllosticta citriasiana TaxID=595635 RepID=A0ABR1KEC3_9PEZI
MASFLKNKLFRTSSDISAPSYMPVDVDSPVSSPPAYRQFYEDTTTLPCVEPQDLEKQLEPLSQNGEEDADESRFRVDVRVMSDVIIGLSDGLTVPFALTAGLSALGKTDVVIYGGLAELTAGAISMGLGGYLGAKSESESYRATKAQVQAEVAQSPQEVNGKLSTILSSFDLPEPLTDPIVAHLSTSPKLVDFLMQFEHSLPEPPANRAFTCAITIALGYFIGGFIPLIPYFFVPEHAVRLGLYWSVGIMAFALFVFGYGKTAVVQGWSGWRNKWSATKGGIEMVIVGSSAALAAMGLVHAFGKDSGGHRS